LSAVDTPAGSNEFIYHINNNQSGRVENEYTSRKACRTESVP